MCVIVGFTQKTRGREEVLACLDRAYTRGPDMARVAETASGWLGFRRLSIMGLDERGMQPFALGPDQVVCNGELYGWRRQRAELEQRGYTFRSGSDCELLLPMYREYGLDMFARLDAEFALILYDGEADEYVAARDPIGIRPLFYGCDPDGGILFASEAKQLVGLCEQILPFPPGHYWYRGRFVRYANPARPGLSRSDDMDTVCQNIHDKLIAAVDKRLDADAPLGFLLSGGLDSSLVCAIAARLLGKPIRTFAIGMDTDAIDLKYARKAAQFIGADHTEVIITRDDVIAALPKVVAALGTWDITTIRASVGMYLCCKAIRETTDIRVLLTGEISDELFGYKYTDFAPSPAAFQAEAEKRVEELYMYDVLRADRCISGWSMEAARYLEGEGVRPDVVCVDPPRKGLAEDVVDTIADMGPQRVVYVSCDPGTLGRDVKRFAGRGYTLKRAVAVDMFPRTAHVETVVLLSKGEVDSKKIRVEFSLEDMDMSEFQDGATYTQIKDYVLEHSGLKVSNLYISQIKRKCGIEVGKNYNLPKSEDSRQPMCPPEKEKAIREAFKYFGMI